MTTIELLIQLTLQLPLAWELIDDRNGDLKRDKKKDVLIRGALGLFVSACWLPMFAWPVCVAMFVLSMAYHFLLFDYLINLILEHNKIIYDGINWFTYMGRTSTTDQIGWWREDPWLRLLIRLTVFLLAVAVYYVVRDLYARN